MGEYVARISGDVPVDHSYSISRRVLKGAAVEVPSDMNDFFVADNMAKIRHELFLIRQRKKEKRRKSEAEILVVSATIAIFAVENHNNKLRIDSQNKLDGSRLAQSKV